MRVWRSKGDDDLSEGSLGKVQAILTILIVPGALILGLCVSLARAKRRTTGTSPTTPTTRRPALRVLAVIIALIGTALSMVGVFQVALAATSYAALNIFLGLFIVFIATRIWRG